MKREVTGGRRNQIPPGSRKASRKVGAEHALEKLAHEYAEALTKRDVEALVEMCTADVRQICAANYRPKRNV